MTLKLRLTMSLRQGRKIPRTLYRQLGPEPDDGDPLIGLVDKPEYAALIVAAVNALPDCVQPCRFICRSGPAHCRYRHVADRMPGWHSQEECPWPGSR